jgi:predicted nucleotidyltransferase
MKPDTRLAAAIDETGRALAEALGPRVVCVALYGSAAGDDFSPEHSDVNLLVVLRELDFQDLRLIGETLERIARRERLRFATPLIVRPEFFAAALDSFPIELADVERRHRVLAGEDVVAGLRVSPAAVRVAAEREARTMLLRLSALVVHRPPDAAAREALSHLGSAFRVVARALLGIAPAGASGGDADLVAALGSRLGVELRGFRELLDVRDGKRAWPAESALDGLFALLLRELDALVHAIDAHKV